MKKQKNIKTRLLRFGLENIGIVVFGALVALLPQASGFFSGKEAMFGVVAGVYWVPPLCDAILGRTAPLRLETRSASHEA